MPQFTGSIVVFLLLASCATLTEDERAERMYDREDELTLAREDYERRSAECWRNGGTMQNLAYSTPGTRKLTAHDYRMVQCAKEWN